MLEPNKFSELWSEEELQACFARLFPRGWAGDDVLAELAPDGWQRSPLIAAFHPSLEQVYQETCQVHRNLAALRRADDPRPPAPEPTIDEVASTYQSTPIDADREVRELVGKCLWNIFSDNHEVIATDGRRLDTGSFRASGAFLADLLNEQIARPEYDYMDFYMGTIWLAGRADLTPVYRMIFHRLRKEQLDWVYHFPRLMLVDLRPLKAALDAQDKSEWEGYDPSAALAIEEEERRHDEEVAELRESLDEGYREAALEALEAPPPTTVRAYQDVYGRLPEGWPPAR